MKSTSNINQTTTLKVEADFFGVAGAALALDLRADRNKRRKAFRQLSEFAVAAGLLERKGDVAFISVGTNSVGHDILLFTLDNFARDKHPVDNLPWVTDGSLPKEGLHVLAYCEINKCYYMAVLTEKEWYHTNGLAFKLPITKWTYLKNYNVGVGESTNGN